MEQDLKKMKYKRGAIKGKLTAFQNFLERFEAEPQLSELQVAELQLRYDKMVPIFDEFDALQTDIEMQSEPGTAGDGGIGEERKLFEDVYYASMSSAHVLIHKNTRRNSGDNASEI
ncbi:uncharacterized protein [Choristoneura fumiferana]|uniref:uncharacterized protein n=1 Tax=Choristoneura fumiferana TaxID=7141 RepID=UPI003D15C2DF